MDDDVRRLLAEARHDDPVPDEVAARLDRVLAGLVSDGEVEAPRVVDLATQRRRHRVRNLLVAAAAVVAVGVGLGQLDLGSMSSGDADTASVESESAAEAPAAADRDAAAGSATAPESSDGLESGASAFAGYSVEVAKKPVRVGDDDFASLAERQAASLAATTATLDSGLGTKATRASWFSCKQAPFGRGRLVAVSYRGTSAVLAVRPPTGDSVVVELLQCGTATVLRSATVPMP